VRGETFSTSAISISVFLFFRFPAGSRTKGIDKPGLNGLSISPDVQFLLYSKVITNGGLILVENFK
jgi:hypothetical protein